MTRFTYTMLYYLLALSYVPYAAAGALSGSSLKVSGPNPTLTTCPVSNCPVSPPVLSEVNLYGATLQSSTQSEFLNVTGLYIDTGDPNGQKVATYIGAMQGPDHAGSAWTLNTDIVRGATPGGSDSFGGQPGSGTPTPNSVGNADSTIGYELDLSNFDKDAGIGTGPFVVGIYMSTLSNFTSTAGILFGKVSGTATSYHDGLYFEPDTISDNTITDAGTATHSIDIEGSHSAGGIYENSTSPTGLQINGSHSQADVYLTDSPPIGIQMAGSNSLAAITIVNSGKVCFDGLANCAFYDGSKFVITSSSGVRLFSIDNSGNVIAKGSVIQNGSP